jgi:hypothetical protein
LLNRSFYSSAGGAFARCAVVVPHTLLEITLPPSAGGRQPVHVFVGEFGTFSDQRSKEHNLCFLQFPPPALTSCEQLRQPGDLIKFNGRNFGNGKTCSVKFGNQTCKGSILSHHKIMCEVPEIIEDGKKSKKRTVLVQVCDQWSEEGVDFEYKGNLRSEVVSSRLEDVRHEVRLRRHSSLC